MLIILSNKIYSSSKSLEEFALLNLLYIAKITGEIRRFHTDTQFGNLTKFGCVVPTL